MGMKEEYQSETPNKKQPDHGMNQKKLESVCVRNHLIKKYVIAAWIRHKLIMVCICRLPCIKSFT